MLKPGLRDLLWMGTGAAMLLAAIAVLEHGQGGENPARKLEAKARKLALVDGMRYSLTAAAEAEKSAVLAVTDEESRLFAGQATTAADEVGRLRDSLEGLLAGGAGRGESGLLSKFSELFAEFRRVDRDLLDLTVKNTNVKAFALTFGPAAEASKETDAAFGRFLAAHASSPPNVLLLAAGARAAALRLESRLAPHVYEESDRRMDEMEALMAADDREFRVDLDGLAALPGLRADPDLAGARSSYARFDELRARILSLSRENTNVRSLSISLNQKRRITAACQEALSALQREIAEEPEPAVPSNPRHMASEPAPAR